VGGFLELELCRERIRALREKDSQTDVMVPRLPFLRN
jgi:hypothetical protein